MSKGRNCLTKGMWLGINFKDSWKIGIDIDMPQQNWDEATCKVLEERLHDAIEYALAPYWTED